MTTTVSLRKKAASHEGEGEAEWDGAREYQWPVTNPNCKACVSEEESPFCSGYKQCVTRYLPNTDREKTEKSSFMK
jgi:hypothetical protein